jgi:hypothetical protein
MVWMPVWIMEIASFLCKALDWKSSGSSQIENYWLKSFPADQRHIKKKL